MQPKISVIVPVYNSEAYLKRCLDTLVNQTLQEIEIVVVNDGSPDNSQLIIDRYAERYPEKVVSLIKSNGGLSDARNFGIAHATGEYLGFVDSDDFVDLDMYERLYAKAIETDSDVVCHPITYAFPEKRTHHSFSKALRLFGRSIAESPRILLSANSFAVNKIYRREFWLNGGFEFPVGQAFEDSAIVYNILYAANKVECVNLPFYYYVRSRDESITGTADERIYDIFKSCDSILTNYRRKPEYPQMKTWVEYVCLKHIFVRFDLLARQDDTHFVGEFVTAAYDYLEQAIPDWRVNYYLNPARLDNPHSLASQFIRRHPAFAKPYYTSPRAARKGMRAALEGSLRARRAVHRKFRRQEEVVTFDNAKARIIEKDGYGILSLINQLLESEGLTSFADFRTLAGLTRDGRLNPNDQSLDMGVFITSPLDTQRVRTALERSGLRCGREYYRGEDAQMAYFHFIGITINLYYYYSDNDSSRTCTFFLNPETVYTPREREIAELTYAPITGATSIEAGGAVIPVPVNAERLLEEKFGPAWRDIAEDWAYQDSPSANVLGERGYYIAYGYAGGLSRSGDSDREVLYEKFYNRELVESDGEDPERAELRKLQLITLDILKEVDRVCREHRIIYYLGEGTMLGAIRHNGFIPWDDDIDILMERSEYERFLKVAPGSIHPGYRVEHQSLLPKYWSAFIKVRTLSDTGFVQSTITHLTEHSGPYIDIFPLDSVPELSSPEQELQKKLFNRYRRSLSFKTGINHPRAFKTRLTKLYSRTRSIPYLYRKIDETYRMLEAPGNQYLVNLASYYAVANQTFPRDWYGEPRSIRFEDAEFPVPARAEDILGTVYGPTYMSPPNIENRAMAHNWVHTRPLESNPHPHQE